MSPPAAIYESPVASHGNGIKDDMSLKKDLAVKHTGQAKTVAEFENNWEKFTASRRSPVL
jgi:thiamine thiazole synthase